MRKPIAALTSLVALVFLTSIAHAATYTEGVNYFLVSPAQPTSVPAGGSSMTAVMPSSPRVVMQRSQRTGAATCSTRRG